MLPEPGGAGRHSRGVTSYRSAPPVLSVFVRAFRTPDLRKKLLFTGAMIVLFRFGSNLPAPGISEQNVSYCSRESSSGGVFALLNLLSGNSDRSATARSDKMNFPERTWYHRRGRRPAGGSALAR